MDPVELFTAGSGGLGAFGAGAEALAFVLVVALVAWTVMVALRESSDNGSVTPLVAGVIRGAVVLGLAGVLFLVI